MRLDEPLSPRDGGGSARRGTEWYEAAVRTPWEVPTLTRWPAAGPEEQDASRRQWRTTPERAD